MPSTPSGPARVLPRPLRPFLCSGLPPAGLLVTALLGSALLGMSMILACPSLARALPLADADRTALEALYGDDACFTLYDESDGSWTRINPARCSERVTPCSTFKVPHALIALNAGVVPLTPEGRPDLTLHWDPQRDPAMPGWPEEWKRANDLASAIRFSVIWYFQELARRIGPEREQQGLDLLGYGNRDISGGLDRFWLVSSLKISADEQVDFFRRFFADELPLHPEHLALVRKLILREDGPNRKFWGKTGSGMTPLPNGTNISLFTGVVEMRGKRFVFALNCEAKGLAAASARRGKLLLATLAALGLDG